MDTFLDTHYLPRLNQKEFKTMSRPITNKEIQSVIKNLAARRRPGLDDFTGEFYQTLKELLAPIFLQLLEKTQEEETLPNSSYKASIPLTKGRQGQDKETMDQDS